MRRSGPASVIHTENAQRRARHAGNVSVGAATLSILVGLAGVGALGVLGRSASDTIAPGGRPRPTPMITSAQAGVVEAAAVGAKVGEASGVASDAARLAELARTVGELRWQLAGTLPPHADGEAWLNEIRKARPRVRQLPQRLAAAGWSPERIAEGLGDARATVEATEAASFRAQAQRDVAVALAEAGLLTQARATVRAAQAMAAVIESGWVRTDAQQEVAVAFAQVGLWDEARAAANAVERPYSRAISQRLVAEEFAEAGLPDEAQALVATIEDPSERVDAQRSVARVLAKAGLVKEAQPEVAEATALPKLRALSADGAWLPHIPAGSAEELHLWGAALVEQWPRFEEAPVDVMGELFHGAMRVAAGILSHDEEGKLHAWLRETPVLPAELRAELMSRTTMPLEQAIRSAMAMHRPAARMFTRGLLVTTEPAADRARQALVDEVAGFVQTSASPPNVEALRASFEATGARHAWLTLKNLDTFSPAMERELAYLMDNHPEVFVIGIANDVNDVDPLLREKGRFGPLYQR